MKRMLDQKQIDQLAELLNGHVPNEKFKELIESLGGTSLKVGSYIYNDETDKLEWVEEIPEDYTGIAYGFDTDGFYILSFDNGTQTTELYLSDTSISATDTVSNKSATLNTEGVNKLNFAQLTHSFTELDETLQGIIEDAITDGGTNGVACSEAQWSAIKELLDNALYLSIDGHSLIKGATDGLENYVFGTHASGIYAGVIGIEFQYDTANSLLFALKNEI